MQKSHRAEPSDRLPITRLLHAWSQGDRAAAEELMPVIYPELRKIAAAAFRARRPDTLQPTAVAHEVYLHLFGRAGASWDDRAHFFGAAARTVRQVLVDHHRRKSRRRRGGGAVRVELSEEALPAREPTPDLVRLDEALRRLERVAPEQAAVVELRFFGGLTFDEVAACLSISPSTATRRWRRARAWLYEQLRAG